MADQATGVVEFRAGAAIARSFSVFFRNFIPFTMLSLVVTSPTYIYTIAVLSMDGMSEFGTFEDSEIVISIVGILLSFLVMAALVHGTLQDLRGERVTFGECFSQGLARMFPVLGVAIVTYIVTIIAFLPALLAFFVWIAFPVLVIPGIIVVVMLWVTIPVAVVERRGIGSLARSAQLTSGYRWRIFFAVVIAFLILLGISLVFGVIVGGLIYSRMTPGLAGGETEFMQDMSSILTASTVVEWVASALSSMFVAILLAVSYHDLRVAKEGVDTEQIAAVFD